MSGGHPLNIIEKLQPVIILFSVVLGVILGHIQGIGLYAEYLIVPFLMIMLYGVFLQIPVHEIKKSFKNTKFTTSSLIMNFIWTPIFAWFLGSIFLYDIPSVWLGFIMLMVTPCTDWYLVFTGISKGNTALSTAILPLNLILQLILLPVYLFILGGTLVNIDLYVLFKGIILVLAIPYGTAYITRKLITEIKNEEWLQYNILSKIGSNQIILLSLAIVAMFASQGQVLINNPEILLKLLIPTLIFFIVNFIVGQGICRVLKFNYEDTVSLNLTTLARNSPIALAIAVAAFPNEPLIALALVIGPLIELPVLIGVSQLLLLLRKHTKLSVEHDLKESQ